MVLSARDGYIQIKTLNSRKDTAVSLSPSVCQEILASFLLCPAVDNTFVDFAEYLERLNLIPFKEGLMTASSRTENRRSDLIIHMY